MSRLINTSHIKKHIDSPNTIIQMLYRTVPTIKLNVTVKRTNNKTHSFYYAQEELRHYKIDETIFDVIDNFDKHRRGNNVHINYDSVRDVMRNILDDIKDYGNNIPDTTDEWSKVEYKNKREAPKWGKRDPEVIKKKLAKRKEFSAKFKKALKW